jgi:hypothetical protein
MKSIVIFYQAIYTIFLKVTFVVSYTYKHLSIAIYF